MLKKILRQQGYLLTFVIFASLLPPKAQASEPEEVKLSVAPLTSELSKGLSQEELIALAHEANEALEGSNGAEETMSRTQQMLSLKKWKEKFDYKNIALNAIRWYQGKSDSPEVKKHAANILSMLLTSHAIETIGGSFMISAGLASENALTNFLAPTIGTAIMVPGLDPLCLILLATYAAIPTAMGKIVYVPRIIILETSQFIYHSLGIKFLHNILFPKEDSHSTITRLLEKTHSTFEIITLNESFTLHLGDPNHPQALKLQGKIVDKKVVWEEVTISANLEKIKTRREVQKQLRTLGWVTRQSLEQVLEAALNPPSLAALPFVETYQNTHEETHIIFKRKNLLNHEKRVLNPRLSEAIQHLKSGVGKSLHCLAQLKNPF